MFTVASSEVLTAMLMNIQVFWDVIPSKKIGLLDPEDGSSTIVRNVGTVYHLTLCNIRFKVGILRQGKLNI
jgi:hypothetical protein